MGAVETAVYRVRPYCPQPCPCPPPPQPPCPCPCVDAEPHMVINTDGDYFLGFGETVNVTCRVMKAFTDITDKVVRWKVRRDSGIPAEDEAWALKEKVVNFNGAIAISFTGDPATNDLSTSRVTTKFMFTAYVQEGPEVDEEEATSGFIMIPTEVNYCIEI